MAEQPRLFSGLAGAAVQFDAGEAFVVAAELTALGPRAYGRVVGVVRTFGMLLQTKVRANASGRPGPRVVTGDYRRSIGLRVSAGPIPTATVGTNAPQGRRLEFGFEGEDSLGRHYNQAPLPHFGPALDEIEPAFLAAVARAGMP